MSLCVRTTCHAVMSFSGGSKCVVYSMLDFFHVAMDWIVLAAKCLLY